MPSGGGGSAPSYISAVIGLIGAGVAGTISGWVTLRGERLRQRFATDTERRAKEQELEKERAAARGVARVLHAHFRDAELFVREAAKRRDWWPARERLGLDFSD